MPRLLRAVAFALTLCLATPLWADDPQWVGLLGGFIKAQNAGYGGLCGLCVDRKTGDVLINVSDRGFYRSTDHGQTFARISDNQPQGRTESPGCFQIDPVKSSGTLLTALVYGAPLQTSTDGGRVWTAMDGASQHVDWAAIDWTDPDHKFVLTLKHEQGELLLISTDGGKSFAEVGKGFGPGWVFDARTAVVAADKSKTRPQAELLRTVDAGKTWTHCETARPVGRGSPQALPKWYDGTLYWLTEGGLISTDNAGESWKTVSTIRGAKYGPIFGDSKKQLFVLTNDGVVQSTDSGATWSEPIPLPGEVKGHGLTWLDYDPHGGHLYLMRMGSDLYRLTLGKK